MNAARVVYSSTAANADALYLAHANIPDPVLLVEHDGERIGFFNALEINRMRTQSAINTALSLEEYYLRARETFNAHGETGSETDIGPGDILALFAAERGMNSLTVGADFPASVLRQAEARGLGLQIAEGPLFPERRCKNADEAEEIRSGNRAAAEGFRIIEKRLAEATVRNDGVLIHDGKVLTSERMRREIQIAALRMGAWAMETIFACGEQACDPHCEGNGPLMAGQLIVADIFPRLEESGYHGDMSRTYLKGTPTQEQRRLVETVAEAQRTAIGMVKAGINGKSVHDAVTDLFTLRGYPTEIRNNRHTGFFHGLGHGLGLDVHEAPRMNRSGAPLEVGDVVTVEPGLYYPGLGGCRIEDVVWVQENGCKMLSDHPRNWIID